MTTGSNISDFSTSYTGIAYSDYHPPLFDQGVWTPEPFTRINTRIIRKDWSGADRVKAARVPKQVYTYNVHTEKVVVKKGRNGFRRLVIRDREKRVIIRNPPSQKVRTRDDVPHAYGMEAVTDLQGPLLVYVDQYIGGSQVSRVALSQYPYSFHASSQPFDLQPFGDNDQLKLVSKLVDRIKGGDFNLAVFLAEGHEALEMIAKNVTQIAKAIRAVRRGNLPGAVRALFSELGRVTPRRFSKSEAWKRERHLTAQEASSRWLELQYGWLPLLDDVKSGAEFLSDQVNTVHTLRVRARIFRADPLFTAGSPGHWAFESASSVRYRTIVAYLSEDPRNFYTLSGLADPELVAWEKLPFSFVADWFIPIGTFLEARAWTNRMVGTFVTTDKIVQSHKGLAPLTVFDPGPNRAEWKVLYGAGNDTYRRVALTRTISTTLNAPLPSFKPLGKAATWKHCANAVALLAGAFL